MDDDAGPLWHPSQLTAEGRGGARSTRTQMAQLEEVACVQGVLVRECGSSRESGQD